MRRAGGIATGVYWEIATNANGKFKIGKEASTTIGLNIIPSGNAGIGIYWTSCKLDINRTLNATSIYNNGVLLTTTYPAKDNALTFSAPFTRITYTISLDLSSYDTTELELRSTALTSYLISFFFQECIHLSASLNIYSFIISFNIFTNYIQNTIV